MDNFTSRWIYNALLIQVFLSIYHSGQLHPPAVLHMKVIPRDLLDKWLASTDVTPLGA
jgi:hypothetical protein